jgi:hypothetical protein
MPYSPPAYVSTQICDAIAATTAWVLYYAGRDEEAERELRLVLRADSGPLREWVPMLAAVGAVYGL